MRKTLLLLLLFIFVSCGKGGGNSPDVALDANGNTLNPDIINVEKYNEIISQSVLQSYTEQQRLDARNQYEQFNEQLNSEEGYCSDEIDLFTTIYRFDGSSPFVFNFSNASFSEPTQWAYHATLINSEYDQIVCDFEINFSGNNRNGLISVSKASDIYKVGSIGYETCEELSRIDYSYENFCGAVSIENLNTNTTNYYLPVSLIESQAISSWVNRKPRIPNMPNI